MNNKRILMGILLAAMISGCSAPGYLPAVTEIDVHQYGSYIKVIRVTGSDIEGELIAIDSSRLVVLSYTEHIRGIFNVPIQDIKKFKLRYANPNTRWTIPAYTAFSITHGWWLVFTAPLNLIVTLSADNAYQYNKREMTYERLKMFARFPQGIPPHIDLTSIQ